MFFHADPGLQAPQTMWLKGGNLVHLVWRVIRPIVPSSQRKKLRIVNAKEEEDVLRTFASPDQMEPRFSGGGMRAFIYDPVLFLDALLAMPGVQVQSLPGRQNLPALGGWGMERALPLSREEIDAEESTIDGIRPN